jgi:hypothetical protein
MKPRDFLNFFKTKSGRLTAFALLFAAGLIIFSTLRNKHQPQENIPVSTLGTNTTDKPQIVESVKRPFEVYSPPSPKVDPPRPLAATNQPATNTMVVSAPPREPSAVPPIALFPDTTAGSPEPKKLSGIYAPFGRLISCETVVTVDSASIQTPIIGLITEDVYHAGKLIIPAGTEVHGTARTDRQRERIASDSSWTLVWQTGEEMRLKAIALDREFDNSTNQTGWAITDGSAGLRGRLIKTDDMAEIKLFAATFLSGAAGALTEKQQTLFGPVTSPTLNNAPFVGAQEVLKVYAQQISDAIQRDGFYVRVPSGKQFYLYVLQTIDRANASVGGAAVPFLTEKESKL